MITAIRRHDPAAIVPGTTESLPRPHQVAWEDNSPADRRRLQNLTWDYTLMVPMGQMAGSCADADQVCLVGQVSEHSAPVCLSRQRLA